MSQARAYDTPARDWHHEQDRMLRAQKAKARRRAAAIRRALVMGGVLVVFAICFGLMMLKVSVYQAQMELNDIQDQIAAAQSESSRLQSVINEKSSISRIMEEASELGMNSPEGAQIIRTDETDPNQATMSNDD